MNKYLNKYCLPCLFLILAGCAEDEAPTTSPPASIVLDYSKLVPSCFGPYSTNPVLGAGGNEHFSGSTWSDPTVIKVGDEYIMYAGSGKYTGGDVSTFDWDIKTYRFVSSDGTTWALSPETAVFESSAAGWDKKSIETPSVVYFKNTYHLFYTGYPEVFDDALAYKIGHATSPDGITWTRDASYLLAPTDPLNTTPNLDFNQWVVAEPGAIVFNDMIYLYYAATGSNLEVNSTAEVVGLVTSSDGISWSAQTEVMRPDQALYPRGSNYKGYSTPSAVVLDGKVHLFYTVVTDSPYVHVKIHHAVSENGMTNWTQDSTAIISKEDQAWHANDIVGPSAVLVNSQVYLWYGGNQGTIESLGIGVSICELKQ